MENTNTIQPKTSLRKIIFMMISILTLVLIINFVYISFSQAIIIDGGSSGCSSCCTNECTPGAKRCSSGTGYQTCVSNYDTDSCYEWGTVSTCSGSTTCGYGTCSSTQRPLWSCTGAGTCTYTCNYSSTCQPACTPATCSSLGKSCGSWSNGCGGTISCGSCSYNQTCSNGNCVNTCTNQCTSGQKRCSSSTIVQTCGNYNSDSCTEWGSNSTCSGSTTCGYGTCSSTQRPLWSCTGAGTCTYTCNYSSTCQPACTPATCSSLGKSCGSWSNGCGGTISCGSCSYNQTCSNGNCVNTCTNQCTGGATRCNGNGYQNCGEYNSDGCTEWSDIISCYSGQTCSNGSCHDTCSNECVSGSTRCSGNGYQTCSNYDTDSCTEWSVVISCPSGQCSNGSCTCNTCNCSNECTSGATRCNGNGYQTCGYYNSDDCTEWSTITSCSSGQTCSNGYCNNNPINVSCSGSPNPAQIGQTVSFVSSVSGGTGSYTYSWTGDCTGNNQNCSQSYLNSGTKTTTLYVTSGSQSGYANCSVTVNQSCPTCTNECSYSGQTECTGNSVRTCGNYDSDTCLEWGTTSTCSGDTSCGYGTCSDNQKPQWYCSGGTCTYSCYNDSSCGCSYNNCNTTLGCYDNDVYYLNYLGQPQNRYQDCGDNYCDNFNQTYCYNGDVYRSRTCYNKGCSGSSCYSYTNTEQQLYLDCGTNQTCSNGQCVNQCECTTGACCDGCHYKTSTTVCNTQSETEYACPWGTGCGSDIGKRLRTKYQYCSGYSATCSGNWSDWGTWTTWLTAEYCGTSTGCSVGNQTCTYKSSCNTYLTKGCYDDKVYWFDQNGLRGALYKSCDDSNTCTTDGCTSGKCTNAIKCDGTTCAKDSKDYCSSCEHCGDGICSCDETPCACPADCKVTTMSVSLLGKTSGSTGDWQQAISTNPDTTLNFLLIFANSGDSDLSNVVLSAALPSEITFNNDVKIDGIPYGGDIRSGISLALASSKSIKTITFSGKVAKAGSIDLSKTDIGFTAQAVAQNNSANDTISIALSGAKGTNLGTASITEILRGWLFWLAVILVCITLLAVGIFYLVFWLVRQRRQKITFQNQEVTLR